MPQANVNSYAPSYYNQTLTKDGEVNKLWWLADKSDVHKWVWATARYLADKHKRRLAGNLHHLKVYSNRMAQSLASSAFVSAIDDGDKIKLNATKSAIDASTAQVATNQPGIMHLTEKGSWELQKRAERMDRFVAGWFDRLQLYVAWLGVFLDACIDGTGFLKWISLPNGTISCERVRSDEIFLDDNENRIFMPGQDPRYVFQMRPVPRQWLRQQKFFKGKEKLIDEAQYIEDAHPYYPWVDEPVTLIEAWYAPEHGRPGRHVICLSSGCVLDEKWKFRVPFSIFRWSDTPLGFFGMGAVEEALPVQIELNWLAQKLQRLLHFATSVIFRERGANVGRITNEDFAIYDYTGQVPQFLNVQAAGPELYAHIDRLYNRIYELLGVSMMEATGVKPSGLYSGEAIRLYHDVATRRFRHIEQRASQFFIDCAEQVKDRAREVVWRRWGDASTLAMGDREVERINWSDVAMERDMYVTRVRPVSIIPQEPAGKVDLIKSIAPLAPQMGQYLLGSLSGIPDLERLVEGATAPINYAEQQVSNIIEKGEFDLPLPTADLAECMKVAVREELLAEDHGVPPDRRALLSRYIAAVDLMQQQNMMPMPGGMPAGGPGAGIAPPGMPGLPPDAMANAMGGAPVDMMPAGAALPGLGNGLN